MYTHLVPKNQQPSPSSDLVKRWDGVMALHAHVEQATSRALRATGLGLSEFRALSLLVDSPKLEVRLLDLADALSLNQSSVSRLVDRLVSAGLARRESCGDDRRGVYIVVTEAGISIQRAALPVYEKSLKGALTEAADSPRLADAVGVFAESPSRPTRDRRRRVSTAPAKT
jgi:DNA-binding MarR family transcriptional regulator